MNETVYWIVRFLIEFAKLFLVFYGIIGYKLTHKWFAVMSIAVTISIIPLLANAITQTTYSFVCGTLCIFIVIFSAAGKKRVMYGILSYTAICVIDIIIVSALFFFMQISAAEYAESRILDIGLNAVSVIVISVIIVIKSIYGKKLYSVFQAVKTPQLIVFLVGLIACMIYITPIQLVYHEMNNARVENILTLSKNFSALIFIGICATLVVSNNSKEHYKEILAANERMMKQQEEYYKMLLNKNNEIRQFKHDINNHLFCMNILFRDSKYSELEVYLSEMSAEIANFNIEIQTGNALVDAIANNMSEKYKGKGIVFKWAGRLPESINISDMGLCAIFSNLLCNAFESAVLSEKEKTINVIVKILNVNVFVTIKNTFKDCPTITNGVIATNKSDKENHGFGCLNVKKCVEFYKGSVEYKLENEFFVAELLLPCMMK